MRDTPPVARESALLDALFADAPVGLAAWDLDLRYSRVNPVLAAMNGVSVEEHVGRPIAEVLPELGPRLEPLLRRIIETGEPLLDLDVVGETPAAPGVLRHWVVSYLPVREDGVMAGIAATIVEVTGEREASARAEAADAQLRAVYAALPLGVAYLSPDLRFQRVNETLAEMNGRSVEAHIGRSLDEILGPVAVGLAEKMREVMATRRPLEIELTATTRASPDAERSFEATYFPVFGSGAELLGVGGVVRDVTDRQHAERERATLLKEALTARAQAEAAQVRAEHAQEEAERERAGAEAAERRAGFLAAASRRMAASMDYEATLQQVVSSAVPDIADWCSVTIVEPNGRLRVLALAHADRRRERLAWELVARHPVQAEDPSGTAKVIRTGEPEVVIDVPHETVRAAARDEQHLRLLENLRIRHYATVPLKAPDGVIGALAFVLEAGRRFSDADLELATALAARAALHIANARLYTERSRIAQTLQASLRPQALPEIPGVELAAAFRAAGDQSEVGGDFYDVFPSGDGAWTAIIGDVSGKGAAAAALTALCRHTLRTAALVDAEPTRNLALLNQALIAEAGGNRFCTALYLRLCPGEDGLDVRLANAGHPLPLCIREDGTIERVHAGRGPLLGATAQARFAETSVHLARGELLVLHTDGVTEVRTTDLPVGERELHAVLREHGGRPAAEIVAAAERRAVDLQAGAPRDDIALLALRAAGAP